MKVTEGKPSHAIVRRSSSGTSECKEVVQGVMGDTGREFDYFVQCNALQTRLAQEGV